MGSDLTMMRCERNDATLTTKSCAARWQRAEAEKPQPWDSLSKCRGCEIGARLCGVAPEKAQATAAIDEARRFCPRCNRPASRLINGLRCISCYNRHLDHKRGFNRRGHRPGISDMLHDVTIAVSTDGRTARRVAFAEVTGRQEAMLLAAMKTEGLFTVAPPGFAPYAGWQHALPFHDALHAARRPSGRRRRRPPRASARLPAPPLPFPPATDDDPAP